MRYTIRRWAVKVWDYIRGRERTCEPPWPGYGKPKLVKHRRRIH